MQPKNSNDIFPVQKRRIETFKSGDELTYDTEKFFVPDLHTNLFFDSIFFDKQDNNLIVWVLQATVSDQRKTSSNLGYALLEQIQRKASMEFGAVAFRYVMVVPGGNFDPSIITWRFSSEVVRDVDDGSNSQEPPSRTTTNPRKRPASEVLHSFIPDKVYIQYVIC